MAKLVEIRTNLMLKADRILGLRIRKELKEGSEEIQFCLEFEAVDSSNNRHWFLIEQYGFEHSLKTKMLELQTNINAALD